MASLAKRLSPYFFCWLLAGCATCETSGQTPERYLDGLVDSMGTVYETAPADAEMLPFPPGKTYELVHGLADAPISVHGYVSFARQVTVSAGIEREQEPNNVSETAGNEAVFSWDEEIIRVRNDTCATFYLRVVAYSEPALSSIGAAGAAGN